MTDTRDESATAADEPATPEAPAAILHATPANPVPGGSRAGYLPARDGKRLRYALYAAAGRPLKGTVVILPGRNEWIEKYHETVGDLSLRGLGAAVMDLRGQGGSDRVIRDPERGHVDSFDDYVSDLGRFFDEIVLPDCRPPYFLLGHSTGALIALLAAPGMVNRVRRMVLSAPLLEIAGLPVSMRALGRTAAALYGLGLGGMYMGAGRRPPGPPLFATNRLTSDLGRFARNVEFGRAHPDLGLGGPTVSWILAACRAARRAADPDFMARIQVPVLFVAAGADEVVSTRAIEDYAARLRSGAMLTIDGARHELLQEADVYRDQFFAAFDAFVPGTGSEF